MRRRQKRADAARHGKGTNVMNDALWRSPIVTLRTPEWVLALYLFLLHFVWEMLQTPFFDGMPAMPHWPATLFCLGATLGDVAIGLLSFGAAALTQRDRGWFLSPSLAAASVFIMTGLASTVVLELHATAVGRWAYSPLMPVLPGLRVGVVPLLQWVVLPPIALFLLRRHHLGSAPPPDA